ncbi:Unknown protein [Striga hermonthica]|uniref:Uncharacterized protein n=1 Tax=Striga hermonthica TaxID=68872 RepID=A0A9N7MH85_STRHE|nr:Unknown protein [Striga hermonthica]
MGKSPNDEVDRELMERDLMIRELKGNLYGSINRMKEYYDRGRREERFEPGDWVYLKLRPYRQHTISQKALFRLGSRFYGPYKILERVGEVAYRLDLPAEAQIHPVVHVSQLKRSLRGNQGVQLRDADMTEAEAAPPPPHVAVSSADPNDVRNLLTMARQLVHQGKPSQALQAVVMAMKMQGGEQAVSEALNRAREMYINKVQASAAADELASLFAECAIAEAMPLQQPNNNNNNNMENGRLAEPDPQGTSILAETGRKQVVLDAFSDGSSFVCLQCGGLVSNNRKEEHFTFWCCNG